LSYMIDVHVG